MTIYWCGKLRTLPRGIGELGTLKQLTLCTLKELQELPNLSGLTALQDLAISYCPKLKRIGKLGALLPMKKLKLEHMSELQELPDRRGLTALKTLINFPELRNLPEHIVELTSLRKEHCELPQCIASVRMCGGGCNLGLPPSSFALQS